MDNIKILNYTEFVNKTLQELLIKKGYKEELEWIRELCKAKSNTLIRGNSYVSMPTSRLYSL